ncbi:signal transduction histidine kinase/CheY-like chemotaxis protein/purine-cytosine permease-like protein [Azospirillum lipoferum]|uniref:histidine kinase n=1 Tax=Azospirillum lipoferum TaxID=193 RepID=A0A5A9GKU0_AZOLI|nr:MULTISPECIES: ATP-binding protein [Azospirillum]KAA0594947.1 response regulator [Azospirillum lipoferum]MCP1612718.1 signal transduction histidine kinase/CheY-like chemotaxis protein/purine-cytosine permease-like protein [Azospirillum lipoferum]MDW5532143.1 ATP-binding protein [Azospirillum sp. NL1]
MGPTAGRQRVIAVRRTYNRCVANQTLEDYALRFTARKARRWSPSRVANTALGSISFLALEAIGGAITLNYGFTNALFAILTAAILIFASALPISYYASRYGVDMDLLTRGAGFGYIGSTITSLIYASFTFIFFAIEAAIMATALEMVFGLPLAAGYVVSSLLVIPLVAYGFTVISRLQLWTQPLWLALHALPFLFIAVQDDEAFAAWTRFPGRASDTGAGGGGGFDPMLFGAAASVVFSLLAQIGEQVDFIRFLPYDPDAKGRKRLGWWAALVAAGPGWIVIGTIKLLLGSFLVVLALQNAVPLELAAEPTRMYLVAFQYVTPSPQLALGLTGLFVVLSQLKINVTNTYAGSIAWSNFFSRLTHSHPGRVVWVVFNVVIGLMLMELGIYKTLEPVLGLYSSVAASWIGALVADLVVNKPLGLSPRHVEFKRAHLYDINPVGVGAMLLATVLSMLAFLGGLGTTLKVCAPFLAFAAAFLAAPAIAWATRGRYYIARRPFEDWNGEEAIRCRICQHAFEPEDMAFCPVYAGAICSLCCSLDARCGDGCKRDARLGVQLRHALDAVLPPRAATALKARLGHYLGVLLMLALAVGAVLSLVYVEVASVNAEAQALIRSTLWKVFFILMIVAGVATWLFVLARESRKVAQEETQKQTALLMQEIEAHERTDAQLQKAKEAAEAANLAKSRYLVGIGHEFRTPLSAIFGYSQMLERDPAMPPHRVDAVRVIRRSAEHLSGLLDGLLDVSKIESGRLQLNRAEVRFGDLLDQLVGMFRLQAEAKGIAFRFEAPEDLPPVVFTDEGRIRQILINLLSNAIKFTDSGTVCLRVRHRSQIAEFEVEDTGPGIAAADLERIFQPFERGSAANPMVPGMGLGLTITKLLTEVMGGEITVTSTLGTGSLFRVRLMMSAAMLSTASSQPDLPIRGYRGRRLTVLVTDDDLAHRNLLADLLAELGFTVFKATDGPTCLTMAELHRPDILLLDISMPGMNGLEVARRLRASGHGDTTIVLVSADTREDRPANGPGVGTGADGGLPHDGFVAKPVSIPKLLACIGRLRGIDWEYETPAGTDDGPPDFAASELPPQHHIAELIHLGRIGYVRGMQAKLAEIAAAHPELERFVGRMRTLVSNYDLNQYMAALEAVYRDDSHDDASHDDEIRNQTA